MSAQLCEVRLRRFPVAVQAAASERHQELVREFSYLAHPHPDVMSEPPGRLLQVVERLESRYGAFTSGPRARMGAASEQGLETIDLTYEVPPDVAEAAEELLALLDEVDDYCRSGELLTLAATDLMVDFRHWFLGEFVRQVRGEAPTPWTGPVTVEEVGDQTG